MLEVLEDWLELDELDDLTLPVLAWWVSEI